MQSAEETLLSLRIKRQKTTFFITCGPFESIDSLKRKILIFHKGLEVGDMRLYHSNKLLDDKSNIHDQGITNNAIVYYKLKKGSKEQAIQTRGNGRTYLNCRCDLEDQSQIKQYLY